MKERMSDWVGRKTENMVSFYILTVSLHFFLLHQVISLFSRSAISPPPELGYPSDYHCFCEFRFINWHLGRNGIEFAAECGGRRYGILQFGTVYCCRATLSFETNIDRSIRGCANGAC